MNLTNEQIAIIESTGDIKINAVAGSGKTTTLIAYAKARQDKARILYIAFNKSVKIEAQKKFADKGLAHVRVETAHSLAYDYIVKGSGYKVKKEGGYKTTEIAEILGLNRNQLKHEEYVLANHINKFITYFCNSDKEKVQELNYEDVVYDYEAKKFAKNFKEVILKQTRRFLGKMDDGEIDITHDFYLKKFHLKRIQLPYDYILFDEGQDASGAMLDLFLNQKAVKAIVGDTHQQIYAWRYAVNSLEKASYPTFHLSSSFRFNNEIAALAKGILAWKNHYGQNGKVIINGYGDNDAIVSKAILGRTNTALLIRAIELLIEKKEIKKLYFEGRFESYTYADEGASIYDVLNLYLKKHQLIKDKLIASMQNMQELEEYIEKTEDAQLALIVEVVKKYEDKLPLYIKSIKEHHVANDDKHNADMIFSTVHRCKGMEYDEVTLTNDFITEDKIKERIEEIGIKNLNIARLSEEINLLYVAVTRTKNILNIPAELLPESKINAISAVPDVEKEETEPISDKAYTYEEVRKATTQAYMPWTTEEDEKLAMLYREHTTVKEIARLLQRGKGAIESRIKKLELKDIYKIESK